MEKNKNSTHKLFKIFILLFLVASVFLLNKDNQSKILDFINSFRSGEKTLVLKNSFDNNIIDVNIYNDTMVLWRDNKISFVRTNDELVLEKEFSFTQPSIYYGENYIYPFDKESGDIYILDKKGETLDRLQLEKEIFAIEEIEENLLCHSKIEGEEKIDILDKNRVLIGNPAFEEKNILSYDINKKGDKILVSLLNLNKDILESEIHYYGENNEELGMLNIEEEIILFNKLVRKDSQIVLTDKSLYYIQDREILWEKEFNLIKDIYLEDEIYILHGNYLETIDFTGESINKIGFTKEYNNIINYGNNVIVYGDENLAIVNNEGSILEHEEAIIKVGTNQSDILILGPDMLNVYQVTNKE